MSVPTDGEDTGQKGPSRVSYKEGVEEGRLAESCIVAKRGQNIADVVLKMGKASIGLPILSHFV